MNRVDSAFQRLRETGMGGLMPFVCAGAPTPDALVQVLPALSSAGAAVIEIGIPFSDPIADGPVIAAAMHDAIGRGVTPSAVFEQVRTARDKVDCALVAMVSVSLVHAHGGPAGFVTRARDAGFDGCIFPDAPLEESGELGEACRAAGLTCSLLVSPTTPEARAKAIAEASTGFVYLLARSGITGERAETPQVEPKVQMLRRVSRLPIACGFGISTPEHVRAVVEHADAAIVGTALVRRLADAQAAGRPLGQEAEAFIAELSTGLVATGA